MPTAANLLEHLASAGATPDKPLGLMSRAAKTKKPEDESEQ